MKSLFAQLHLLLILLACEVKQKSEESVVISGHRSFPNSFNINAPIAGSYYTGDALEISLSFPVAINMDETIGLPQLILDIGGVQVAAQYVSGDGTNNLKF